MPNKTLFFVMLENSRIEQIPVNIYLTHHLISGIVTNVDDYTVELRIPDGKRCAIALDKIEAIAIA
jgi:sRNA-binding regulator protein Hfq